MKTILRENLAGLLALACAATVFLASALDAPAAPAPAAAAAPSS